MVVAASRQSAAIFRPRSLRRSAETPLRRSILFWYHVGPVLEVVGYFFRAQRGSVNAEFIDRTIERRVGGKQRASQVEAIGGNALEGTQGVGGNGENAIGINAHEAGGRIQHAGNVEIGLVVEIAADADDAFGRIGIHHREAKVPAPAVRRKIEIQPAVINKSLGTLVEDTAPSAVGAQRGPELESHGLVTGDQSARQIDVRAGGAVEVNLPISYHGGAFQSAVGVADRISCVTVEAVAMLQRGSG